MTESGIRIAADVLSVRRIGPWLREAIDAASVVESQDLLTRAELAIHEACVNVVDHGEVPPGSTIDLSLHFDTQHLVVTVIDHGTAFDPGTVEMPAPGVLQERGYGVKIIRSIVDELTYERVGDTNQLRLRIALTPATTSQEEPVNE